MLGDCHVHMVLDGIYYKAAIAQHKNGPLEAVVRERLAAYRAAGIHFVRDGGDAFGVCALAAKLAPEYEISYRTPLFPIHKEGHYGGFIGRGYGTSREFGALLARVRREGGNFVKLMLSGLMDFHEYGRLTDEPPEAEEIRRRIACAHDAGFAVMVHANGAETVRAALEAGADSVEHGSYMDDDCLRLLARSGAVWTPTLATVGNLIGCGRFPDEVLKKILEMQTENIRKAAAYGAKIALGSDAGAYLVPHVQGARDEYRYLKIALGAQTDEILSAAQAQIREKF